MQSKLSVFLVDPDSTSRGLLRQALRATPGVVRALAFASVGELLSSPDYASEKRPVLFISARVDMGSYVHLRTATERMANRDLTVLVRVVPEHDTTLASLGSELADGFHSLITEPYSIDSLRSALETATRLQHTRLHQRELGILELVLKGTLETVDEIARRQLAGLSVDSSLSSLQQICGDLRKLTTVSPEEYIGSMRHTFRGSVPLSEHNLVLPYGGVSRRVQQLFDRRRVICL